MIDMADQLPLEMRTRIESATVTRVERLWRWLAFSVLLAMLPIFVLWLFRPKSSSASEILSGGELFLIAVALTFTAAGEIGPSSLSKLAKTVGTSISTVVGLIAALYYVRAVFELNAKTNPAYRALIDNFAPLDIPKTSIWVFIMSVIIGGSIVLGTTPLPGRSNVPTA
jgi:hypothetical protein